ncbi:MAG: hypothetical protein EOP87_10200 [Verrucomicrobiaceae bacterium]|nr:MAG: hypothetical protein EOP87_10200 [Verrucomicrobiaceae bacterium]
MKNPHWFRTKHAAAVASIALSQVTLGQITKTYEWFLDSEDNPLAPKSWHIDANWALGVDAGVAPSLLTDEARITNGGTSIIENVVGVTPANMEIGIIFVGGAGGSNLIVNQDIAVYTRQLRIGSGQVGTVTLDEGYLALYSQEGPSPIPEPELVIGIEGGGLGTLTQTGGTLDTSATRADDSHPDTRIGAFGASGIYNLEGGTASLWNLRVGFANPASVGTINHSGGTLVHTGELALGWADAKGIYNLSGDGDLQQTNNRIRVGATAGTTGIFNQSGGTALIEGGRLELGTESGAHGTYNMSGGTMTVNDDIFVGAFDDEVPKGTTGVYNQTGGAVVANRLWIAFNAGTSGSVFLGGGTLKTQRIFVEPGRGTGTVTFDGGTLIANGGGNIIHGMPVVTVNAGGATIDSNTFAAEIQPPMVGPGGLTKIGPQSVSLTALSDYEGDTVITEGQLILNHAGGLNPTSSVKIPSTGANLVLNYTGQDKVSKLIVDGVAVAPGLYGSATAPGVAHTIVPYLSGTGLLKVEPVAGYDTWASNPANGLAVGERAPTFDADNDGFNNLMEYFLGGNPKVAATSIAPQLVVSGGNMQVTFNRSVESASDTTAVLQWSTNLASWPAGNQIPVSGTGAISLSIPGTNAVGGKLFTRLKVTKP